MLDNLNSNFESSKAQRPDANDDEVEIDLLEIFYALKKKILLVLMVALVGGCIAAAYTQFLMTPNHTYIAIRIYTYVNCFVCFSYCILWSDGKAICGVLCLRRAI